MKKPIYKISQVAEHIDVSSDRIRTYEEQHLIVPFRNEKKVRLYSNIDIEWIENLRALIGKDKLSIAGFKEILRLSYIVGDSDFEKFIKKQDKKSIWPIFNKMRKIPIMLN